MYVQSIYLVAFTVTFIEATDTLESGFRGKSNGNFGAMVVDCELTPEGVLRLITKNNDSLSVPLSTFFASKLYAQQVAGTPPASETTAGRAKVATLEEVIAGESDFTIVTPLKLFQKLEDFFSNATHLADAADEISIGHTEALIKVLGPLSLSNPANAKATFNLDFLQANTNYEFKLPDTNPGGTTVLNDYNYLVNKPNFFFTQESASNVWAITHNIGKKVICQTFNDDGEQIFGSIKHIDDNELHITFNSLETGYALLMGI